MKLVLLEATSQLVTHASHHTVNSAHGQLVTRVSSHSQLVTSEHTTFPMLGMEKQNLIQQNHVFKCRPTAQNTHKKLNPGLAASYNIRLGNREGPSDFGTS